MGCVFCLLKPGQSSPAPSFFHYQQSLPESLAQHPSCRSGRHGVGLSPEEQAPSMWRSQPSLPVQMHNSSRSTVCELTEVLGVVFLSTACVIWKKKKKSLSVEIVCDPYFTVSRVIRALLFSFSFPFIYLAFLGFWVLIIHLTLGKCWA